MTTVRVTCWSFPDKDSITRSFISSLSACAPSTALWTTHGIAALYGWGKRP